jgi:hypothetical protein
LELASVATRASHGTVAQESATRESTPQVPQETSTPSSASTLVLQKKVTPKKESLEAAMVAFINAKTKQTLQSPSYNPGPQAQAQASMTEGTGKQIVDTLQAVLMTLQNMSQLQRQ